MMKLIFALLLLPMICFAQQPWVEKIHRITFEAYDVTLKYWGGAASGFVHAAKARGVA